MAGGVYSSKPRPAVILQDNLFSDLASVTVCPMTSGDVDAPLMRLTVPSDDVSGLDATSFVMVDKITTVRRANVAQKVGKLTPAQMLDLERMVLVFLGLAD